MSYCVKVENVLPGMRVRKAGNLRWRKITDITVKGDRQHVVLRSEKFFPTSSGHTRFREMWYQYSTILRVKEG